MAKPKWYQDGLRFTCIKCGNCCTGDPGYVWVTKEEIRRIAEFQKSPDGKMDAQHLRRAGLRYSLTEHDNGDCCFLGGAGGDRGCTIYPVRPLQCRTWPFWTGNLRSQAVWDEAAERCPGMNNGMLHTFVQIERIRTQKSW